MNYYPHHIGDFNSATRHLTRIERSVYRDLIELYYDTEAPLVQSIDRLCRLVVAHSDEERTAVEQVLNEFFTESEQGWVHARCEQEIAKYQGNKVAKSAAGKASAAARAKGKTAAEPSKGAASEQVFNSCSTEAQRNSTNQNQNQNQEEQELPAAAAPGSAVAELADEPKAKAKRKTSLPATFLLTTEMARWGRERAPAANISLETEKFCNHYRGKGETRADWVATWRTWMLNAQTYAQRSPGARPVAAGPDFESLEWTKEDLGI